jgi:hypothetical protein
LGLPRAAITAIDLGAAHRNATNAAFSAVNAAFRDSILKHETPAHRILDAAGGHCPP